MRRELSLRHRNHACQRKSGGGPGLLGLEILGEVGVLVHDAHDVGRQPADIGALSVTKPVGSSSVSGLGKQSAAVPRPRGTKQASPALSLVCHQVFHLRPVGAFRLKA